MTQTLKETDRYLTNSGFTCSPLPDAGSQYLAHYEFGNLKAKKPWGISLTLRDYGDGRWTYYPIEYTGQFADKILVIENMLKRIPGFERARP
jgi:hypothetical protein